MNFIVVENKITKVFEVIIDDVNYGVFDQVENGGHYAFFPKRNDRLTGDHYILIGEALNKLNSQKSCG